RIPQWALAIGIAGLALQIGVNLNRSITHRRDMGQVMVVVDQAYDYVDHHFPNERVTLAPDFRPYDYHPDAAPWFQAKTWLSKMEDLDKNPNQAGKTYVISWGPSLWAKLEVVEHFTGCTGALFDKIWPCSKGTGAWLMRYIGSDSLYDQGEAL